MHELIRIGLVGYGRAGKAVAKVLAEANDVALHWIVRRSVDPVAAQARPEAEAPFARLEALASGHLLALRPVDVIVDFSAAEA